MECRKCFNLKYGHHPVQAHCTSSTHPTKKKKKKKKDAYNKVLPFLVNQSSSTKSYTVYPECLRVNADHASY